MADKKPKEGLLKKVGRGARFAFLPVGAWRTTAESFQNLKTTGRASLATLRAALNIQPTRQTWHEAIARYGVTYEAIEKQVNLRQTSAYVCLVFMLFAIYGFVAWGTYLPSMGCFTLALIYYAQAALRLYQIRHRKLCSFFEFVAQVSRKPSEALPLGLPDGWKLR